MIEPMTDPATRLIEIEKTAIKYWPDKLTEKAGEQGYLVQLFETQDEFLSIIKVANKNVLSFIKVVNENKSISPNLFLKHLMVLSDFGGEQIKRLSGDFKKIFPDNVATYFYDGVNASYRFISGGKGWNNKLIKVEKNEILKPVESFTPAMQDVAFILMWGANIINNDKLPPDVKSKCMIGSLSETPDDLDTFVKQRYIHVSRQTGGSLANDLGYLCEDMVRQKLSEELGDGYQIGGHTLEGLTQNGDNESKFDIVVKNKSKNKSFGIEISFQVTTNSTIERKAGQAPDRKVRAEKLGHKVCHIIDGSGNFERKNAIKTIIQHSHLVVNMSDSGIVELSDFIKNCSV